MITALKNILLFVLLPIKSFLKVIKSLFGWLFRLGTIEISVVLLYNLYQHTINPKDTIILIIGMLICGFIGY